MTTYLLNHSTPALKQDQYNSSQVEITVPEGLRMYNIFLVFQLPGGKKIFTRRLEQDERSRVTYPLNHALLSEVGRVLVELQGYTDNKLMKSITFSYTVVKAVAALDEPAQDDFVPWYVETVSLVTKAEGIKQDVDRTAAAIKTKEKERQTAEQGRTAEETVRKSNETARKSNETARQTAESSRVTSEQGRQTAESNRVTNEQGRQTAESNRVTNEQVRVAAEGERVSAEAARHSEVILARGTEPTLGARLDADKAEAEQRIDQIITTPVPTGEIVAQEIIDARSEGKSLGTTIRDIHAETILNIKHTGVIDDFYLPSDKLILPADFPSEKIPFNLTVDDNGHILHDYNINDEFEGINIYMGSSGSDANDGLTPGTSVAFFSRAVEVANNLPTSKVIINLMDRIIDKDYFVGDVFSLNKDVVLRPYNNEYTYITSSDLPSNWTSYNSIYQQSRTAVRQVFDSKIDGKPIVYKQLNSIAEVESLQGSWFTDDTIVYVNTADGRVPDNDIIVNRSTGGLSLNINGNKLVLYRCVIGRSGTVGSSADTDGLYVIGNESATIVNYETIFLTAPKNGLAVKNIGKTFSFGCKALGNGNDGFNYHGLFLENPYQFVFEYGCIAYDNGFKGSGNNNATTAHEGIYVLRINCEGYSCDGPILADVNGCYSIAFNCKMYNSVRPAGTTKSGFYFNNTGGVVDGRAYLINCGGGGLNTLALNSDKTIPVYLRNFKGKNIPDGNLLKLY